MKKLKKSCATTIAISFCWFAAWRTSKMCIQKKWILLSVPCLFRVGRLTGVIDFSSYTFFFGAVAVAEHSAAVVGVCYKVLCTENLMGYPTGEGDTGRVEKSGFSVWPHTHSREAVRFAKQTQQHSILIGVRFNGENTHCNFHGEPPSHISRLVTDCRGSFAYRWSDVNVSHN